METVGVLPLVRRFATEVGSVVTFVGSGQYLSNPFVPIQGAGLVFVDLDFSEIEVRLSIAGSAIPLHSQLFTSIGVCR